MYRPLRLRNKDNEWSALGRKQSLWLIVIGQIGETYLTNALFMAQISDGLLRLIYCLMTYTRLSDISM